MSRKYVDCREMPSEINCDLAMAGSEEHVLEAAAVHAVTAHVPMREVPARTPAAVRGQS